MIVFFGIVNCSFIEFFRLKILRGVHLFLKNIILFLKGETIELKEEKRLIFQRSKIKYFNFKFYILNIEEELCLKKL